MRVEKLDEITRPTFFNRQGQLFLSEQLAAFIFFCTVMLCYVMLYIYKNSLNEQWIIFYLIFKNLFHIVPLRKAALQ